MPFKKGHSGNPSGKPKGAISEKTKAWEELGEFFTQEGADTAISIIKHYGEVVQKEDGSKDFRNPDKFLLHYNNLLEFFRPKLQRSESSVKVENDPITFILPK